jgi:hypothetical protein
LPFFLDNKESCGKLLEIKLKWQYCQTIDIIKNMSILGIAKVGNLKK